MKKCLLKKYHPLALSIALISTPMVSYAASQESVDLAQQMYVAYYGRPGDPGGWAWWADKFDESSNLNDALAAFGNSQEYYDSFGELSNEQLITNLYQQLFNRDPDAGGLAFYSGWLSEGKATLASIAKQIADGAQNSDATVLNNKIMVANYFSDQIKNLSAPYYADDIPSVQYILNQVDDSTESVTAIQDLISSWIPNRDLDNDGILDAEDDYLTDPNNGVSESDNDDTSDTTDSDSDSTDSDSDDNTDSGSDNTDSDSDNSTDSDSDNTDSDSDDSTDDPVDSDGDGVDDSSDAFPNDPDEIADSDGDGTGDNADAFPNDASEVADSDGDGIGDNADDFPNDASEIADSDGDGTGDNADAFPNDASETADSDGDGTGDNADAFPNDASEITDSDGDGTGDNADAFPNDASETADSDGDGTGDNADAFPNDASETSDSDGDGTGDNADAFPNDASEIADSDGDGIGDNADPTPNGEDPELPPQTYAIVDTNQELCFSSSSGAESNCSGKGYDADYDGNQPDYTVSDDNLTVTDNVTGVMWTRSPDLNNDGSVTADDKLYQYEAVEYCANLSLAGYDDWRLPNIKTAYSLIDFSGQDPSGYEGTDTSQLTPFLNSAFEWAFGDTASNERLIDAQYATTTIYVSTTMYGDETMFGVNLVDGRIKGYPTVNKGYYVHCARGNENYGINNFSDNGDNTVSDSATGLMWQQNDTTSTDWEDAISQCEAATTAGHSDWRLPNIKELQSILDYSRSPDTHNSAAIDPVFNATSFTNEEGYQDWGSYWSSTTHQKYTGAGDNAAYMAFGRALGYIDDFLDVHGAGAQRSDNKVSPSETHKVNTGTDNNGETFYYHGPQGDILRADHQVRCVRDIESN